MSASIAELRGAVRIAEARVEAAQAAKVAAVNASAAAHTALSDALAAERRVERDRATVARRAGIRRVCTCWRLRPDGSHGRGCDFYEEARA